MSAIGFVVRDGAGNIQRGSVAGEGVPSSIIVGAGADVSLNLTRGQIVAYTRQGQALQITLLDGRVIVIEGFFTTEGVAENQLFISADGYLTEVELTAGAGDDYFANFVPQGANEKFALNDDLYFMRGADVMLADDYVPTDDEVGMFAPVFGALGLGPLLGAGAAVGAATLIGGGGGGGGPDAPEVAITSGTGNDEVVNEEDYADGVEIGGTGTPGGVVVVTVEGVDKTVTVTPEGTWEVVYDPGEIPDGTYETGVSVTITTDGGSTTATSTLVVDTELALTFDSETVEGDGTINAVEMEDGTTLTGTVEAGSTVIVTIDGNDYEATVDGTTWSVTVAPGIMGTGETSTAVTVTATDGVGNTTSVTESVEIDTITYVSLTSTAGGADGVVNGVEHGSGITLTGEAQPGASVLVSVAGVGTQTVIASGTGSWSASWTSGSVPTGETSLDVTVTATDGAGNTATTTGAVEIDTYVNELTQTSGQIGGDGVVNFDENGQPITVTGTVEAGSSVNVTLHGTTQAATVDANGNWTVTFAPGTLPPGEYATSMTISATDAAGNTSTLSEAVQVDTVAGNVALSTAPIEIDDVVNANEAADGVWISGTATPGLLVTVGFGTASHQVYADVNGNWTTQFAAHEVPADTAAAPITASITDAAGNFKEVSDTVKIDTVVENYAFSSGPIEGNDVISAAEAADGVMISGTVEPHSSVSVEFGGETQVVNAGANGQWSVTFSSASVAAAEYTETITATATDPAGNVKTITDTVQVDTIVNELTTADPVEGDNVVNAKEASDGITLVGTVEAGSTVMVNFQGNAKAATVDANGNWSVTYTAAEVGTAQYTANVSITATDAQGNTSTITDTFEVDTIAPEEAPNVETVLLNDQGVEAVGIDMSPENTLSVAEIKDDGSVGQQISGGQDVLGNTYFEFNQELPTGSHLVVSETDAAGNSNSTYLVLEEAGTNAVDLNGLEGFDIGAIDLGFAVDTTLTIDAATLQGLSDNNNELIVHGDGNDHLTLTGGTAAGSTSIDGKAYDIYTMGDDGVVYVEDGVNVTF